MKNILTKKCLVCGKEFTKPVNCSKKKWGLRKFCSRKCTNQDKLGKHYSRATEFGKREYTPWLKGTKGVMKPNSGSFKKGQKLSEETKAKMRGRIPWNKGKEMKEIQGKNHPNWKGGRTDLRAKIRTTAKYKRWRTAVFERDSYKCQNCRRNCNRLQVHHIKPFYKILEDNKLLDIKMAKQCDELWDINNGQTLCTACHKQTDSYLVNQHTK